MQDHRDATPQALVERICRGEAEALGELFDCLADHNYAIAVSILRNPDDAEEILNDVFARVWTHAERYDPKRGSVAAWVGVMTRSRCLDRLRQLARRGGQLNPEDSNLTYLEDQHALPEQATEQALLARAARGALAGLSEIQRRILRLAYFRDMSQRDIAEMLQLPLGTVKSHCRRGLGRLRQALDDFDPAAR
ncbi:MAG: sigma-70 family RNA polymerase sigma factor [Wenzhouxiangella sp.]|nr:MAG: sigma-70 family RNA polymerase sigma factor [Wenzhouxiangella sp.]